MESMKFEKNARHLGVSDVPINPMGRPSDEGEIRGCSCNDGITDNEAISCDRCSRWFHFKCACISVEEAVELARIGKNWYCLDCIFVIRRERAKASLPEMMRTRENWEKKMEATEKRKDSMLAKLLKEAVRSYGIPPRA